MSKRVRLKVSGSLGGDLTTVSIYKNSITASNLLTASITASELNTGILFDVPDNVFTFVARADSGKCLAISGSATVQGVGNTRFFTVVSDGQGTVQINAPDVESPVTSSLEQPVNFNVHSFFTIEAVATYPISFDGWYSVASGSVSSPTVLSTSSILTIEQNTFTGSDDFYAYFS
jgi:hypothetical protein